MRLLEAISFFTRFLFGIRVYEFGLLGQCLSVGTTDKVFYCYYCVIMICALCIAFGDSVGVLHANK